MPLHAQVPITPEDSESQVWPGKGLWVWAVDSGGQNNIREGRPRELHMTWVRLLEI